MQINPSENSVSYKIEKLELIEGDIQELERYAIETKEVSPELAKHICHVMNSIRSGLGFKSGIRRHDKFKG